jgi:tRNA-Thr(GGU) m(6)t(6)A37 methyltransferase TsaA
MPGDVVLRPIGVVRTPFHGQAGTPIQPSFAEGARGTVVVEEPFAGALADLDGFTHVWLLVHLDRAGPWRPRVVPFRDTRERGLFATRAPSHPNPIGLSVVRLVSVRGREVVVDGVDLLDGTPLLDIKPYAPEFDSIPSAGSGWLGTTAERRDRADGRFSGA